MLLRSWTEGSKEAEEKLFPMIYGELRVIAARYLSRERPEHTLQPTALVHEAYLRLVRNERARWHSRQNFYAIASKIMRRVLVDHARGLGRDKRKGEKISIDAVARHLGLPAQAEDLMAVDQALGKLGDFDPDLARLAELRIFGGSTIREAALCLGTSPRTVNRQWRIAKAWLSRHLGEG